MRYSFDPSVYFVVDPSVCGGNDIGDVVRTAAKGGVSMVQLRNKEDTADVVAEQGKRLLEILEPFGIPLLINDYVQVAKTIGAHGVHVGQDDMPVSKAREIMGEEAIVGITAFEAAHFTALDASIVDYTGTGPCYPTLTKPDKPVLGLDGLAEMAALSSLPLVGIGGITPENAGDVMRAGADGVAMMRSISEAEDPQKPAYEMASIVAEARLYREAKEVL